MSAALDPTPATREVSTWRDRAAGPAPHSWPRGQDVDAGFDAPRRQLPAAACASLHRGLGARPPTAHAATGPVPGRPACEAHPRARCSFTRRRSTAARRLSPSPSDSTPEPGRVLAPPLPEGRRGGAKKAGGRLRCHPGGGRAGRAAAAATRSAARAPRSRPSLS